MNVLGPLSDLGPDRDFVTRIGPRDPVKGQRGRGAGFEGAWWLAYAAACRAFVELLARPGHVKMQKIAAIGGTRIKTRTNADERQTEVVHAWRREL